MGYDRSHISYEKLLDVFWAGHNPFLRPWSEQYASIIFYHNEEQKKLALESRDRLEASSKAKVYTEIRPASDFYLAEGYHQKYYLQNMPELMDDFRAMYPSVEELITSTAAARVNGYAGGYGSYETLQKELASYGLSDTTNKKLLEIAQDIRADGQTCPTVE